MSLNNKLRKIVFGSVSRKIFFLIIIMSAGIATLAIYASYEHTNALVFSEISSKLKASSSSNEELISSFFSEKQEDLLFLSNSPPSEILTDDLLLANSIQEKNSIKSIAINVSRQIEEYLIEHPDYTLSDLQSDEEFKRIAVQPVGKTGYTAIADSNTLINRFHISPEVVNLDLSVLSDSRPEFWAILSNSLEGVDSEGFYPWLESDGSIRNKYLFVTVVNASTADGIVFNVAATSYLDEYPSLQLIQKAKRFFMVARNLSSDFAQFFFINAEGTVLWSTNENSPVNNVNLHSPDVQEFDLTRAFKKIDSKTELFLSDLSFCRTAGEPVILGVAAIKALNGSQIGLIGIKFSLSTILDSLAHAEGLGEIGESYLIGQDYLMRSQSRFSSKNTILEQKVETENAVNCFSRSNPQELHGSAEHEAVTVLEDYRGVRVIATHHYLPIANWCLLTEIDEKEALGPRQVEVFEFAVLLFLFVLLGSIFFAVIIGKFVSNPVNQLGSSMERVKRGDLSQRVKITSGDELQSLGDSFNEMVEALSETEEKRKQLERAKTEFLSITSHELRSPMTPMKAQLQMLLKNYYGKLNAKQREALDIVLRNTDRLDRILLDFLEISRIEAARLKFNFVKASLAPYTTRLVEEMNGFMQEKSIKIELRMGKLPEFEVDPDRIMQVLRNLINNAKKFSKAGSKITVTVIVEDKSLKFSVKDKGIGLSAEDQARIFEPFYQAEQTMYREHGGTGLGLTICKGIIESQKGRFWVESTLGKGCTFNFTVPFAPVKETKSIKLLFAGDSAVKDVNSRLKECFVMMLGPLGGLEFNNLLQNKQTDKEHLLGYVNVLVKQSVINKASGIEFKRKISEVLE